MPSLPCHARVLLYVAVGAASFACDAGARPLTTGGSAGAEPSGATTLGSELVDAGEVDADGPTIPCRQPEVACGDGCHDVLTDVANCGACGHACAALQKCYGGTCSAICPSGTVVCAGACIEPNADRNHCGATPGCGEDGGSAGRVCGPYESCFGNQCLADGCSGDRTLCNGRCVDATSDPANCGACGNRCGSGKHCTGQICCPTGMTGCNGACIHGTCS